MAPAQATLPLLHRFFGVGLVILSAVFGVLKVAGVAPLDRSGELTGISYVLSGAGVLGVAVALLFLKPRVPDRPLGQSVENYWATPEVGAKVLPVWFLMEGAGVLSAVGYLLTGAPVSAVATILVIMTFWLSGPDVFAKN